MTIPQQVAGFVDDCRERRDERVAGAAIFLIALAFNSVGDAMRDAAGSRPDLGVT